jgi:pilus assembly protein CpaF
MELSRRGSGALASQSQEDGRAIEVVVADLRVYLGSVSNRMDSTDKIKHEIVNWVQNTRPVVNGYTNASLIDRLTDDICNYGILTYAMQDPDVFEIRCNGRELKVEKKGRVQDYTDQNGKRLFFQTVEEQEVIMRKLLGDVRLSPKDQLVSGRTIEGYRIAANHYTAMSEDPDNPTAPKFCSFVLRKFQKSKMTVDDIVSKGTMTDEMGALLKLLTKGGLTFLTVGPTASGKTTTNNAILKSVPPTTRTVLVQNPSEIDIRHKDAQGLVSNDVLHLEAHEAENPLSTTATMENVMNQVLRLSPTFVCFGEIRTDGEFQQAMKIMQAGHPINATYHAKTVEGAIWRFVVAYMSASGNNNVALALQQICSLVQIIIVQKILRDGTRKIIEIGEIVGSQGEKPIINILYKYDTHPKENEYNEKGEVTKIAGEHVRISGLSDSTIEVLKLEGVPYDEYSIFEKREGEGK